MGWQPRIAKKKNNIEWIKSISLFMLAGGWRWGEGRVGVGLWSCNPNSPCVSFPHEHSLQVKVRRTLLLGAATGGPSGWSSGTKLLFSSWHKETTTAGIWASWSLHHHVSRSHNSWTGVWHDWVTKLWSLQPPPPPPPPPTPLSIRHRTYPRP